MDAVAPPCLPPQGTAGFSGRGGPRGSWCSPSHRQCRGGPEATRAGRSRAPPSLSSHVTVASRRPEPNGKLRRGGRGRPAVQKPIHGVEPPRSLHQHRQAVVPQAGALQTASSMACWRRENQKDRTGSRYGGDGLHSVGGNGSGAAAAATHLIWGSGALREREKSRESKQRKSGRGG